MSDKFLMYAAIAAGAYFLLGRGAGPAAAGGNGPLTTPFPEFAPIEPSDSGSFVAPDVIPYTNGIACCMAMTEGCMECARRNWGGVTNGALSIVPRPALPSSEPVYPTLSDQLRSYPDYGLRHPGYTTQPVPY